MKAGTIAALAAAAASRHPVAFAKRLTDAAEFLLPNHDAPVALNAAGAVALAADKSGTVTIGEDLWFIEARNPAPRLILIGAVHIAQFLAPLAATAGFFTILVDPRTSYATESRFPGVELNHDWPDVALDALRPDARTAVVVLTHDPKLDDPALERALGSDAFYIGALGSRKTHQARLERLAALGQAATALARIRGPVGLPLGAVTAPEIALSIIAELVAVRRGGRLAARP